MFIKNKAAKKPEKRLLEILGRLSESQIATLTDFAEFLANRPASAADMGEPEAAEPAVPQPVDIPRPEKESVVKAIKRLAATYPMVDRAKMLNETSTLMTQHIMHGRDAVEVINELEIMFRTRYEAICIKDKKEDEKLPEK
jgi:hypothetical protein